jgi:hypothetical protein
MSSSSPYLRRFPIEKGPSAIKNRQDKVANIAREVAERKPE